MGRRAVLEGNVGVVRIEVRGFLDRELDAKIANTIEEGREQLEAEVSDAVRRDLGREFKVEEIVVQRGSVEILVFIATAYYAASHYKDFIESVHLLVLHLRLLITRLLPRRSSQDVWVDASWVPSPLLAELERSQLVAPARWDINGALLLYLVLSNAALLAFLLWVAARRLG
jgi:hypothetical protein